MPDWHPAATVRQRVAASRIAFRLRAVTLLAMTATEIIGLAASLSLLAGWRLYAVVLAAGLAVHFGVVDASGQLSGLAVLGNWWVLAIAGIGTAAEFSADKVPWLDSAWDAVHTLIRPVGGALLALAVVRPGDGVLDVATLLLGGGAALAAHAAKAGGRAVINASPEPISNFVASTAEDGLTTGGLYIALAHPALAAAVAAVMAVMVAALLWWGWRMIAPVWRRWRTWGKTN